MAGQHPGSSHNSMGNGVGNKNRRGSIKTCVKFTLCHKFCSLMMFLTETKSAKAENFMNVVYHRYQLSKVGKGDFQTLEAVRLVTGSLKLK